MLLVLLGKAYKAYSGSFSSHENVLNPMPMVQRLLSTQPKLKAVLYGVAPSWHHRRMPYHRIWGPLSNEDEQISPGLALDSWSLQERAPKPELQARSPKPTHNPQIGNPKQISYPKPSKGRVRVAGLQCHEPSSDSSPSPAMGSYPGNSGSDAEP